jgi:hypothetical protein
MDSRKEIYIPAPWMDVPTNLFDTKPSTGATRYIRSDLAVMTKEIWQNIIKALQEVEHFDCLDELELAMAYEKHSGEKIPDDWRILY